MSILKVENISKHFGNLKAVDELSFEVVILFLHVNLNVI